MTTKTKWPADVRTLKEFGRRFIDGIERFKRFEDGKWVEGRWATPVETARALPDEKMRRDFMGICIGRLRTYIGHLQECENILLWFDLVRDTPMPGEAKAPSRRRGPKRRFDPAKDKRIFDGKQSSDLTKKEYAEEMGLTLREVTLAMKRHRTRGNARQEN
jgi:hypothetical protein